MPPTDPEYEELLTVETMDGGGLSVRVLAEKKK